MDREPVLIILTGLAAVLSTMLVATNALAWTHLDGGQTASVIAAVAAFCALVAAAIRGQVYSPATVQNAVTEMQRYAGHVDPPRDDPFVPESGLNPLVEETNKP